MINVDRLYFIEAPANNFSPLIVVLFIALAVAYGLYNYRKNQSLQKRLNLADKFTPLTEKKEEEKQNKKERTKQSIQDKQLDAGRVINNISDVLLFISIDGDIKYISASVKDFLGYEAEQLNDKKVIKIIGQNDFNRFDTLCKSLYEGNNLIEDSFKFKTKAGLLKLGESAIKAYSDHKWGEGYIASIRPLSTNKIEQQQNSDKEYKSLIAERDSLNSQKSKLEGEIADLRMKITKILQEQEESEMIKPLDFAEFNAERLALLNKHFNSPQQQINGDARELIKLLNSKRMSKYHIIDFCELIEQKSLTSSRFAALWSAEQAIILRLLTDYNPNLELQSLTKMITEILTPMADLFSDQKYLIDIDIEPNLKAEVDVLIWAELIRYLVLSTMVRAIDKEKTNIEITFKQNQDQFIFSYQDDVPDQEQDYIETFYASFLKSEQSPLIKSLSKRYLKAKKIDIEKEKGLKLNLEY